MSDSAIERSTSGDSPIPATLSPLAADSSAKVSELPIFIEQERYRHVNDAYVFQNLLPYYIKVHGHPQLVGWTFRRWTYFTKPQLG
jgi:hypothetical protein